MGRVGICLYLQYLQTPSMQYKTYPECTPSFAEEKIISKLNKRKIAFDREVSFTGLVNPITGQPLRYDFYIPAFNLIIEYDGVESHSTPDVKERDAFKDKFAKDHNIGLIRISGIGNIDKYFNSPKWLNLQPRQPKHKKKQKPTRLILNTETPPFIKPATRSQQEIRAIIQAKRGAA